MRTRPFSVFVGGKCPYCSHPPLLTERVHRPLSLTSSHLCVCTPLRHVSHLVFVYSHNSFLQCCGLFFSVWSPVSAFRSGVVTRLAPPFFNTPLDLSPVENDIRGARRRRGSRAVYPGSIITCHDSRWWPASDIFLRAFHGGQFLEFGTTAARSRRPQLLQSSSSFTRRSP